jgi:hypothetical protein
MVDVDDDEETRPPEVPVKTIARTPCLLLLI